MLIFRLTERHSVGLVDEERYSLTMKKLEQTERLSSCANQNLTPSLSDFYYHLLILSPLQSQRR